MTKKFVRLSFGEMQQRDRFLAQWGFRKATINFGWLFAERIGRLVFGALIGVLVARYLGPQKLGSLSYCVALVTLLGFLPALGLDAILKRDLLKSPALEAEFLASAFVLRLAMGAASCAALLVWSLTGWGLVGDEAQLLAVLALLLFQPVLFLPELWLQAHLHAKRAVAAQFFALTLAAAARVWLIAQKAPLTAFAWVVVGEMLLVAIGFAFGAQRLGLRMPLMAARVKAMCRLFSAAWPLMFTSLAIVVYMKIDEVMLRQLAGPSAVGIYAAAAKLSEVWYFLPIALASSVLPALLRAQANDPVKYSLRQQQYYDLSAAVAYGLSVPIALSSSWIVRVAYSPEFSAGGPILAVHIWSSVFVFVGVARGQWLVNEGLQKFYLAATVAGAMANVGLNFVFIPRWSGLGAAWATVISYGLAAWLASYFHPLVRSTARMQTRALLIPFLGWRYFRRA